MKRSVSIFLMVAMISCGTALFALTASAEDATKMVGVITKIDMAGKDAKTATVTITDSKTEQPVTVVVNDELTLDKFKDHRIVEGDEIRVKFETKDGKNISVSFKKTAGC